MTRPFWSLSEWSVICFFTPPKVIPTFVSSREISNILWLYHILACIPKPLPVLNFQTLPLFSSAIHCIVVSILISVYTVYCQSRGWPFRPNQRSSWTLRHRLHWALTSTSSTSCVMPTWDVTRSTPSVSKCSREKRAERAWMRNRESVNYIRGLLTPCTEESPACHRYLYINCHLRNFVHATMIWLSLLIFIVCNFLWNYRMLSVPLICDLYTWEPTIWIMQKWWPLELMTCSWKSESWVWSYWSWDRG